MRRKMITLVEQIQELMLADDDDQSDRLAETYQRASSEQKLVLDEAFICLCGYSLNTIIAGDA